METASPEAVFILPEIQISIVAFLALGDCRKGNVAINSSNYGNNGEIHGPKWTKGKYGSGLLFDGVDDYVEVKDDDTLLLSEEGLTIAVWLKTEQSGVLCAITIDKGPDWGPGSYYMNYPGYSLGKVRFQIHPVWVDSKSGVPELSDNEWHYAVGTYDTKTYRVYVDGKLEIEQSTQATIVPMVGSAYIGSRAGNTMFYKGVIDELLVANVPFTAEQLKKHMEGKLYPVHPIGKLAMTWGKIKVIDTVQPQLSLPSLY